MPLGPLQGGPTQRFLNRRPSIKKSLAYPNNQPNGREDDGRGSRHYDMDPMEVVTETPWKEKEEEGQWGMWMPPWKG